MHPCNPWIAYAAGATTAIYDFFDHRQLFHLVPDEFLENEKKFVLRSVSCVSFSPDGNYLAVGESGHQPRVLVWDLTTRRVLTILESHKFGVLALEFIPDTDFLVSVGFQHDGNIILWNWRTGDKIAANRSSAKISSLSVSSCGGFFVTCGVRHFKYWLIEPSFSQVNGKKAVRVIESKNGTLGEHKGCTFTDVALADGCAYSVTDTGILVYFGKERLLEKWVDLKMAHSTSIHCNGSFVACGGSDGTIRIFECDSLKFICSFPKIHEIHQSDQTHQKYPSVLSLKLNCSFMTAVSIFDNKSIAVFNYQEPKRTVISKQLSFHQDAVWGCVRPIGDLYPRQSLLSYSTDGTLRLWDTQDLEVHRCFVQSAGIKSLSIHDEYLATGDMYGNIRVYSDLQHIADIEAHDGEVLSLDFKNFILATSSRDRLIHLFDTSDGFELMRTIECSCSVPFFRFFNGGSVSLGADKSLVFRDSEFRTYATVPLKFAVNDLAIHEGVVVTQDKALSVYSLTGKFVRNMKLRDVAVPIVKFAIDQGGKYIACCGSDKRISVYEAATGNCLGSVFGHAEGITSIGFWDQGIFSTCFEGCVFLWTCDFIQTTQGKRKIMNEEEQAVSKPPLFDLSFVGKLPAWARPQKPLARSPIKRLPTNGFWAEVFLIFLMQRLGNEKSVQLFSENSDAVEARLDSLYDPRRYSSDSVSTSIKASEEMLSMNVHLVSATEVGEAVDEDAELVDVQNDNEFPKASEKLVKSPTDRKSISFNHFEAELARNGTSSTREQSEAQIFESATDLSSTPPEIESLAPSEPQKTESKKRGSDEEVGKLRRRLAALGIVLGRRKSSQKSSESSLALPPPILTEDNQLLCEETAGKIVAAFDGSDRDAIELFMKELQRLVNEKLNLR